MTSPEFTALKAADVVTLALNNQHAAETSLLDQAALDRLVANAFCALSTSPAGTAFLIAFDQDADYASPNFLWFRERYQRFVYVDRVVVAAAASGRGLASALYAELTSRALAAGHDRLLCEINADPPNPRSDAFHAKRGFVEVGRAVLPGSAKTVRYMECRLPSAVAAIDALQLRSFGRRKGHTLSQRRSGLVEALLPKLAVDLTVPAPPRIDTLFPVPVNGVWLEVGFGGAEHLLWQASQHPDRGLIGCEPFINGIAKALAGIEAAQLGNVRLHAGDAREVMAWLPARSVERAFILFPDPWPKKRHRKRRIVSVETLRLLARLMPPGAELRLATDIASYARAMLAAIAAEGSFIWSASRPSDWRLRPADWPQTRYEQKAIQARRRCCYFRFHRL